MAPSSSDALWTPSAERAQATNLFALARQAGFVDADRRLDYGGLHRWSVESSAEFWSMVWDDTAVIGDPGDVVLHADAGSHPSTHRFFPQARLNVAENLIERGSDDDVAIVSTDEAGRRRQLTRRQLRAEVAATAHALRADGVQAGDRVAAWLPNTETAIVVMLAAASIGAVVSTTSPDFGPDGVLDRFGQIEPVVLVACAGYDYGGKRHDRRAQLSEVAAALPTLRRTVTVDHLGDVGPVAGWTDWDEWVSPHRGAPADYARLPFDHPWYVLFSSGTTGVPKCIVHRGGGVLLQHLKEHRYHCDIRAGDNVSYYTTCGWMMWNWLASVLASTATVYCYEGSPFHPDPLALFRLVERESLSLLGVGAKLLDSVAATGLIPSELCDLGSLRTICSTGSPLVAETHLWIHQAVGADLHSASISGGTDICGCFVAGDPTSPVFAGEIQRPALGMAVDVIDEKGDSCPVGDRGELACTAAFPSVPLGFWDDGPPGVPSGGAVPGSRFFDAYYASFDGVWTHGDFASWTEHGGVIIHGRSDTTLNPGGVRIGTAEIYRQVDHVDGVVESLVFGRAVGGDSEIVLLVVTERGITLDDTLRAQIARRIRVGTTPRHVPRYIVEVADLPRTRSGKLAEMAVADIVNGRVVRNTTALANPECLATVKTAVEAAIEP